MLFGSNLGYGLGAIWNALPAAILVNMLGLTFSIRARTKDSILSIVKSACSILCAALSVIGTVTMYLLIHSPLGNALEANEYGLGPRWFDCVHLALATIICNCMLFVIWPNRRAYGGRVCACCSTALVMIVIAGMQSFRVWELTGIQSDTNWAAEPPPIRWTW